MQTHTHTRAYDRLMVVDRLLDGGKFQYPRQGRHNDQAHPPIHPTKSGIDLEVPEEIKIYEFITRRFLACCSDDAKGLETWVECMIAHEVFSASGKRRNISSVCTLALALALTLTLTM